MVARNHIHRDGGDTCKLPTKKACDDAYADWQAMQQVRLAAYVIAQNRSGDYRKDKSVFGQLVQLMAGDRESLDNKDGTAASAPFTRRILSALNKYKNGAS